MFTFFVLKSVWINGALLINIYLYQCGALPGIPAKVVWGIPGLMSVCISCQVFHYLLPQGHKRLKHETPQAHLFKINK